MRLFRSFACCAAFLLWFASCEYHPEGINFQHVDSVGVNTIQIALDQMQDTIVVGNQTEINFALAVPSDISFDVTVWLGNNNIYNGTSGTGSFYINGQYFDDGFYPFTFEVITASGTGSLADKLGAEKLLFQYKKVVLIDKSPAQALQITSVIQQQNGLLITWPEYPRPNLKEYVLYKTVQPDKRGLWEHAQFLISDIGQTSFTDNAYLGGRVEYRLRTITQSGDEAWSDIHVFNGERPRIATFSTKGVNQVEVKWTKSEFPSAFGRYHLVEDYTYGAGDFCTSTDINDTTCIVESIPFGKPVNAELRTLPPEYTEFIARDGTYSTFKEIYAGEKIPEPGTLLPIKSADRVYYFREGFLYVMRHAETKPYDSLALSLNISDYHGAAGISPNGEYFYVCSGQKMMRLDPLTLDEMSSITLSVLFNDQEVYPFTFVVGDDHRLIVDVKRPGHSPGYHVSDFIAIVDGNTNTVSDTIKTYDDVKSMYASADLRYFFINTFTRNKIYELSASGQEVKRSLVSTNRGELGVFTDTELYAISGTDTKVILLSNFAPTLSSPHVWFDGPPIIDPLSGYVGVMSGQYEYSVYKPLTMELVHKINVNMYSNSPADFIQLMNGRLFSKAGFRMALP